MPKEELYAQDAPVQVETVTVNAKAFEIPKCLKGGSVNDIHTRLVHRANYYACEMPLYENTRTASKVCPNCSGTVIVSPYLTQEGKDAFSISSGKIGQPYVEFRPFRGYGGG